MFTFRLSLGIQHPPRKAEPVEMVGSLYSHRYTHGHKCLYPHIAFSICLHCKSILGVLLAFQFPRSNYLTSHWFSEAQQKQRLTFPPSLAQTNPCWKVAAWEFFPSLKCSRFACARHSPIEVSSPHFFPLSFPGKALLQWSPFFSTWKVPFPQIASVHSKFVLQFATHLLWGNL